MFHNSPTRFRRLMSVLATAATAALLAVSVPMAAIAAPVADATAPAARASSGPLRMADVGTVSTITVSAKSLRTGDSTVAGLENVVFGLFASSQTTVSGQTLDSPGAQVMDSWATCTTNSSGVCTITVPFTGNNQANHNVRYWVKQLSVSPVPGYYLNQNLITGNNTSSGGQQFAATPQVFRTGQLSGSSVNIPANATMPQNTAIGAPLSANGSTSNRWVSGDAFAVSEDNNRYQATCTPGFEVAIVLDLSLSMDGAPLQGAKDAAKAFVNQVKDLGVSVALYTFSTDAPANSGNANGQNYAAEVVTSANLATFNSRINAYTTHGYTNWDRGLWQVANAPGAYDLAVVLTDGNPTVFASEVVDLWTNVEKVQESIYSANALKHEGTQIFAFGAGSGITGPGANLAAVSGPTKWDLNPATVAVSDYSQSNDWTTVATGLGALARSLTCVVPITVVKTEKLLDGSTRAGKDWEFTAAKTAGAPALSGPAAKTTPANGTVGWELSFTNPSDTATVNIAETPRNGWQLASVVCNGVTMEVVNGTFTLGALKLGDNLTCNVTNQQVQASVKVDKVWIVNGTTYANGSQIPSALAAQLKIEGTNQDWGVVRDGFSIGASAAIRESLTNTPALCTVISQVINGPGAVNVDVSGDKVYTATRLPAGTTTYTVTNKLSCTSTLTLVKNVTNDNGGSAAAGDWTLSYASTGVTSGTTSTVAAGQYALSESSKPGYAPRATDPLLCTSGLSGTTVTVGVGEAVTCTFYNDDIAPTLRLEKIVVGADGIPATNWTLTAKDGSTVVVTGAGSTAVTAVKANTDYSLTEAPIAGFTQAGDFDASAWECQKNGTGPWTPLANGVLPKTSVALDDDIVCRITNTAKGATPTITKTVATPVQNADGTWTITYLVTVANPSKFAPLTYTLSDTLAFGGSIVANASASGPGGAVAGWTGVVPNTVLATGVVLAANSTHVYTVTAIATVPNGETATACPSGSGSGGFMNRALLTVAGKTYPAEACAAPVKPTFVKDPGTATSNTDGTWTLTYTLTATNSTSIPLYFDLVDNPQATLPAGVTVVSGSVSPAGSWNPLSNTTVADDAVLPANSSKAYTITLVVGIAPSVTASTLDCSVTGKGLKNSATLTSGGQILADDACLTVVPPTIVHDKTVTSTSQNPDGTWTIVYDIVVKNTGSVTGTYDLGDTVLVDVAGYITLISAAAADVPGWDGVGSTVLATARAIEPGASKWQHYTITVVASVAQGKMGTPPTLCEAENGKNGFLNTATITVAGVSTPDSACSSPTAPTFSKQFTGAAPAGANSWNVTYLLTVDNSAAGSKAAYYTLTDTPGFASQLTITGQTVTSSVAGVIPWNGGSIVPSATQIAAGTSHTYTVVIAVTVPPGVPDSVLTCTQDKAPGFGLQNSAALVVGNDTITRVDCGDVTKSAVPTITKVIAPGWPRQLADGTWEIKYTVVVSSDGDFPTTYSLTDKLGFGADIVVNSAAISSPDATPIAGWNGIGQTAVVTDQELGAKGADATDTFTVVVNASVPKSAYTKQSTVCDSTEALDDGGFLNTATLTSGQAQPRVVHACDSPAQPSVAKVVDPANPPALQGDGSWLVSYLVTVTNDSDLALSYNLSDTLGFPVGVTISEPTAVGPLPTIPEWDGAVDTELVHGAAIPAKTDHVYTITVKAAVTSSLDLGDISCTKQPQHGLFNGVVLNSGGIAFDDSACTVLPVSELTLVKEVDNSAFEGVDLDGRILASASDWVLAAEGPADISGKTGTDDVTTVLVPSGEYTLQEGIDLSVDNPLLSSYIAGAWDCADGGELTLEPGDSIVCTITNTGELVDLKIVKTSGGEVDGQPLVPTNEDSAFDYTFEVTNQGELDATGVVVTDVIPATLKVNTAFITLPSGWTVDLAGEDADGFGGTLTLTKAGTFGAGETANFVFEVQTAASLPRSGDGTSAILDIANTAIVGSDGVEKTPEDNTSTEQTPVKSIVVDLQVVCVKDAPYATWSVTPTNTDTVQAPTVVLVWWTPEGFAARDRSIPSSDVAGILADGAQQVDVLPEPPGGWASGVTYTGTQLWPGGGVDADGVGNAWPGWVKAADGTWSLDVNAPFYAIHAGAVLEVRMNLSSGSVQAYPPATPDCSPFPPFEPPTLPLPPDKPVDPITLAMTGVTTLGTLLGLGAVLLGFGGLGMFVARLRRRSL